MTKVRRGPAAQDQSTKRSKASSTTGPHLAGNRNENLLNPRSCTPSDEDVSMTEEFESTTASLAADTENNPDSPASERFSSLASYSSPNFPTPSTSRASLYHSVSPQNSEDIPIRPAPPRTALAPLAGKTDTYIRCFLAIVEADVLGRRA